jgi:riboflavin kinase/FMN adenylyltransferase
VILLLCWNLIQILANGSPAKFSSKLSQLKVFIKDFRMRHFWSLEDVHLQDTWLTIGTFDGVHRGHQEIVRNLVTDAHAVGAQAVVLTFFPHPAIVLGKRQDPFYLTTPDERAVLLGNFGVDAVITFPFTPQISTSTAHDFVSLLKSHIGMRHLMVGPDFALGRDRGGNIQTLKELGGEFDFSLTTISPVEIDKKVVSSSRIRAALSDGDLDQVNLLLGRSYFINGQVVPGDGRGHTIGIPTANLSIWLERALPKSGVYASKANVNGHTHGSVTNIGIRPTFNSQQKHLQVETHLLNFDGQIYGQEIQLEFISRLRDEKRFPSVEALVNQITRDISEAKRILSNVDG